jgi:DNA transposition AAA+ family ATPase
MSEPGFIVTKEYRRFAEFCDACRYGPPGVGKTLSAQHYAQWHVLAPALEAVLTAMTVPTLAPEAVGTRTVLYTPTVTNTLRRIAADVDSLLRRFDTVVQEAVYPEDESAVPRPRERYTALLVVDEADRLKMLALEQLRDLYDRGSFGLVLIGMPGLEKRLARYAQLYSRVGFVHEFRALAVEEMRHILTHKWR